MDEYINKIKYLKEKVKISLKDENNQDKNPVDNRNDFLKQLDDEEKILKEINSKAIVKIYSSQLLFLEYEDLEKMAEIAAEVIIADDCLLYDTLENIIDKGE